MTGRKFLFPILFLFLASQALSSTMPKRGKRPKTRRPPVARLQPGPRYERAAPPPSFQDVQQILADQKPGSPTEIAAQGVTGQSPCGDSSLQARAQALQNQVMSLANETIALSSRSIAASFACGSLPPNCTEYNFIIKRLGEITAELAGLIPQAEALKAQASQGSGNCGGATPMALPPSLTRDSVAKKFGFRFPGGGGAGLGGLPSGALEQLEAIEELDEAGGLGFDGAARLKPFRDKLAGYASAARAASILGARSEGAKQRLKELKESGDKGPEAEAERDYYKVNYAELGPKYEALVRQRGEAALSVAGEALDAPVSDPRALMPKLEEKPLMTQLKDIAVETIQEEAKDHLEEKKDEAMEQVLSGLCGEKCAKAVMGVKDITEAAKENISFDETWKEAVSEMASASTSTGAMQKLMDKLDAGLFKTGDKAQKALENVLGD